MSDSLTSDDYQATIDLAELARIGRGDRIEIEKVLDSTQELFDETLALVKDEVAEYSLPEPGAGTGEAGQTRYMPENEDLRTIYLLAEAVGGYEAFHDLVNVHSVGSQLSRSIGETARQRALSPAELRELREFQQNIHVALKNANAYLRDVAIAEFGRKELIELQEVMLAASERAAELNRIMGTHLMHEIENAVARLYEIQDKIHHVEKTIDGIFLVDSEVMFIPTNELIEIVNTLFEGIGNTYLARNVDGVLLLAARNLLIEVASFHSYYGKTQIYNVLSRRGSAVSTQAIASRIRREIHKLFEACKQDNKLVLTRIMTNAEREFEVSVQAIQTEAETIAVEAVRLLIPPAEAEPPPPPKRGLLRRLFGWFTGSR